MRRQTNPNLTKENTMTTLLLAIFFNPDTYLPHFVALATLLGLLIEPFHRQIDNKAVAC
jgi:hypothetical protein